MNNSKSFFVDPKEGIEHDPMPVKELDMMKNPAEIGYSLADRLDENFYFLLNFLSNDIEELEENSKKNVKNWLERLSVFANGMKVGPKIQRAVYMNKLVQCITDKKFTKPFDTPVNDTGDLPNLPDSYIPQYYDDKFKDSNPEWLQNLMENTSRRQYVGGRLFETYLSTKFFDDDRGACAYLAMSANNEGDKSAWSKLKLNERRAKKLEKFYDREMKYMKEALDESIMENDLLTFDDG
jgi:hypothetical protein